MALKTTLAQLEEVQTAITTIMNVGQSYTIDGQTFTRANLDKLTERESMLLARYNVETRVNKPRVSSSSFAGV